MRKIPLMEIRKIIVLLALIIMTIACKYPVVYDYPGLLGQCERIGGTWNQDKCYPPMKNTKSIKEESSTNFDTCNATQYLLVNSNINNQGTNEFGTWICEYSLNIKNTHPEKAVWFWVYVHWEDGLVNTETDEWKGTISLAPDLATDLFNQVSIHNNEDFDGTFINQVKKVAGVFDIPECSDLKQDENYLEEIAIPVEPMCSQE